MEKIAKNPSLQDLVRKTLHRIQELEKEVGNLKVHGGDSRRLEGLLGAYWRLLGVCFEIFEMEDAG